MNNKIRYGDYFREASIQQNVISYDDLVPGLPMAAISGLTLVELVRPACMDGYGL